MGFRLAHLVILFLALGSWSHPFESAEIGKGSFVAKIRRSAGQPPPAQNAAGRVFDPTYATDELRGVLAKYAPAAQFLAGIGLNPDTHPEAGYKPFTHPLIGALNSTNSTATNVTHHPINAPLSVKDADESSRPPVLSVPGTTQLPLTDYVAGGLDILYYGSLEFGTQGQAMTVDIDTGSADLWVPVNCRTCGGNSFNAGQSSSYRNLGQRFSVTYGAGKVSGTLAQDTVGVGGLAVVQQAFGAVRTESEDFYDQPSDGLLGLAFGSIAQSKRPTFFEGLMVQKQVAAGAFAVHLARGQVTGSEICFGCFDTTKAMGPITWNSVVSRTYWSILMDGLSAGPTQNASTNLTAAIDTGTTLIYVPDDVAAQFYSLIPGSQTALEYGAGFYTFPCSAPLAISLSFGGRSYSVNMNDFNLGQTSMDSGDCVGGILAMGQGFPANLAIIGDEFLKSWYSVYDYPGNRVGFAPSINNQGSP